LRGDHEVAKLGPDHPDTLSTLHNLAGTYQAAGKLPEAIRLYEKVRDKRLEKLGPDHPDSLITLGNLAVTYSAARQFDREELIYRRSQSPGYVGPNYLGATGRPLPCKLRS
jgi:hypothetical protein